MPSLLLVVFLVELAIQVVGAIGAAALSNGLWNLYTRLPSRRSAAYAEQRQLQAEYLELRRALAATSSQDEFAKWARLRRQHDKKLEQLEKTKTALDAGRRSFDTGVTALRLALTRGLQYGLPLWYARAPMFWLPHGWFPAYAEWLLAFPRAPRGSVSIASWQLACAGVLLLLKDTVLALAALATKASTAGKGASTAGREASTAGREASTAGREASTASNGEKATIA